jgi:hypothetical protein
VIAEVAGKKSKAERGKAAEKTYSAGAALAAGTVGRACGGGGLELVLGELAEVVRGSVTGSGCLNGSGRRDDRILRNSSRWGSFSVLPAEQSTGNPTLSCCTSWTNATLGWVRSLCLLALRLGCGGGFKLLGLVSLGSLVAACCCPSAAALDDTRRLLYVVTEVLKNLGSSILS